MKYKINLTVEWDGESGKRESERITYPENPKSIIIPHHGGEIKIDTIAPDTLRIVIISVEKTRAFAIKIGSVLRIPLGAPLKRGSIEITPENE